MPAYLYVAVFALVGIGFVGVNLLISSMARVSAPSPDKLETYECGPLPVGDAWGQMNPHYYLFALLFVVFDVEAAFLFPWALAYKQAGWYAVAEMLIFVGLLLGGWFYALRRRAMEWE